MPPKLQQRQKIILVSNSGDVLPNSTGLAARIMSIFEVVLALLYITFAIYNYESGSSYETIISNISMGPKSEKTGDKSEKRAMLLVLDLFWGFLRLLVGLLLFIGAYKRSYRLVEVWLIITIIFFVMCLGLFAFFIYIMISISEKHGIWIVIISLYFIYKIVAIWFGMRLLEKLNAVKKIQNSDIGLGGNEIYLKESDYTIKRAEFNDIMMKTNRSIQMPEVDN